MEKKQIRTAIILVFFALIFLGLGWFLADILTRNGSDSSESPREEMKKKGSAPSDWFVLQRTFPGETINIPAYRAAVEQAKALRANYQPTDEPVWVEAGPSNIGGRITALGVHPSAPEVIYAGAADGGVLKSVDGGGSWTPVFDEAGALSIGAIVMDPNNPNTIWVGTGEANASGDSYPGDGIYRSTDGGATWEHMGLENSYHIGRIAIDPFDSERIFVAAAGALFGTNPERGIYRTENGGSSWERMLYLTDSTAAIDVILNPQNTQIVYAAMWERIRHPDARNVGGVTSGIWRSSNGGDTWELLTNGLPPSAPEVGRIGLTISPSNPNVLYALYCDHPGYIMGVWKTMDGGDSWTMMNSPGGSLYYSYGWYFGNIYVDPVDYDKVYALGVPLKRSTNGGNSWSTVGSSMHVDHHAFWINPENPNYIVDGNDGGVYYSNNGGDSWIKCYDLHISQFYANEIDFLNPHRLYGGTQDNGTLRTWTGAVVGWDMILGGDGFYAVVDYTDSEVIFAEYQWGGLRKSTNGGNSFSSCLNGVDPADRRNWCTPVVMDPVDHNTLYYGTYRLYKTTDSAGNWVAISGDLTNGVPTGYTFHTITTIAVAPRNTEVIYVGTDDGNVWVTQNGGDDWNLVSESLPERWVTRVAVSPRREAVAYVTISGYRMNEYLPHVFRTTDFGENWEDISGNLPESPVNVIIEDPERPRRLFVGTDMGAYFSRDLGAHWRVLGAELPNCTVSDMKLHNPTRTLVAGTHGRSMYKLSREAMDRLDSEPLTAVSAQPLDFELHPASPNPFNAETTISFRLDRASRISLTVYNSAGQAVKILTEGNYSAGAYSFVWKAEDMASGAYFYTLRVGERSLTEKVMLVK